MGKVEVRAVIKYLCKRGISPKIFHDDFTETLWDESLSYSTVKKEAAEEKGWESVEGYEQSDTLKRPLQTKTLRCCTI